MQKSGLADQKEVRNINVRVPHSTLHAGRTSYRMLLHNNEAGFYAGLTAMYMFLSIFWQQVLCSSGFIHSRLRISFLSNISCRGIEKSNWKLVSINQNTSVSSSFMTGDFPGSTHFYTQAPSLVAMKQPIVKVASPNRKIQEESQRTRLDLEEPWRSCFPSLHSFALNAIWHGG